MVALVTGGGRGIGQGIALRLAKEGWAVAVTGRSADQLQETRRQSEGLEGQVVAIPADVSRPDSVKEMVRQVEETLGHISLLVNNAGTGGPLGPFWENDANHWWHCQEVNLRGPMLCCREVLPGMVARNHGRIINIASLAGGQPVPEISAYVISKTALIRFSEQLAQELQAYAVKVFAIHPGAVRTAMVEEARHKIPLIQQLLDAKAVTPDAAADLILFLASGEADSLSGHFFSVDENAKEIARQALAVREKKLYLLRGRTLDEARDGGTGEIQAQDAAAV
jgi:NAD(P)-dependent dehydrogenase (short-subunit alcohol dehydrogenase family)